MPEAVAPVTPAAPAAAPAAQKPVTPPVAAAKPEAAPTVDDAFELVIGGEKQKRSWSDPETRKAAIAAMQKAGYSDKSISDSRTLFKGLKQREAAIEAAFTSARGGDPKPLLALLKMTPEEAAANPEAVMKLLGVDPDAHARTLLSKKLDREAMTPEQQKIADLEAKVAEADKRLKSTGEQRRQERVRARAKQEQAQLFKDISAAGERIGLVPDEHSLGAIYVVMEEMHASGIPWSPEVIVQEARDRIDGTFKRLESQVMKGLKGADLAARLGPEVMKELRNHLVGDKEFIKGVREMLAAKLRNGQKLDDKPAQTPPADKPAPAGSGYRRPEEFDEQVKLMGRRHG